MFQRENNVSLKRRVNVRVSMLVKAEMCIGEQTFTPGECWVKLE
jgi:hypothetical protein